MYQVLVCDDDKAIVDAARIYLESEGYAVLTAYNGKEAVAVAQKETLHCIILDIMMPVMDGIAATVEIRKSSNVPIIFLSAKSEDTDKITGLSLGADDYVTKPFSPPVLIARIKAQLRRSRQYNGSSEKQGIYEFSGLRVNTQTHECFLYDSPVALTPTEFGILKLLCERAGKVIATEEIFETVWGERYLESNNTVMVHIRRIREKLHEPAKNPRFVKTVWGVGYKLETGENEPKGTAQNAPSDPAQ